MAKLLYEVKDGIAWIRLNRPEVLNALSSEELGAFVSALREAADDPGMVRAGMSASSRASEIPSAPART